MHFPFYKGTPGFMKRVLSIMGGIQERTFTAFFFSFFLLQTWGTSLIMYFNILHEV